jgi:superfamily II DNA/RNA helicase
VELSNATIKLLKKGGISEAFPIQVKTYSHIYEGKDLIASDMTGSGKTLAFALPVIEKLRNTK